MNLTTARKTASVAAALMCALHDEDASVDIRINNLSAEEAEKAVDRASHWLGKPSITQDGGSVYRFQVEGGTLVIFADPAPVRSCSTCEREHEPDDAPPCAACTEGSHWVSKLGDAA